MSPTPVAVIGSGNIGTDLMIKIMDRSPTLQMSALVGIDPGSDGLARARRRGVAVTADGVRGLITMPEFDAVDLVFDATSAGAHAATAAALAPYGKRLVDLTPAALGPYVVPPVNLAEHLGERDVNMVTCGGQATIPIVAAIAAVTPVAYAEIVASIASRSAGPATRANIDEFTETTSRALEVVGGAARGKAIIILNPAEPPLIMRDTVLCLVEDPGRDAIRESVQRMVAEVAGYVPGYRLKQEVQFQRVADDEPLATVLPGSAGRAPLRSGSGAPARDLWKVSVFLEVEGAADYLPAYAGNLDIMTSAALRVGERLAPPATAPAGTASTAPSPSVAIGGA